MYPSATNFHCRSILESASSADPNLTSFSSLRVLGSCCAYGEGKTSGSHSSQWISSFDRSNTVSEVMQNSPGSNAEPNGSLVIRIATLLSEFWYWFVQSLFKNHITIHLAANDAFVWRRLYDLLKSILLHIVLVLGRFQCSWWISFSYKSI